MKIISSRISKFQKKIRLISASVSPPISSIISVTASTGSKEGAIIFTVIRNGEPLQDVEIHIDGKSRGNTGFDGILIVEWLLAGAHSWDAIYGGEVVASGDFTIPEVTKLEFIDFKAKKTYSPGEFATGTFVVKNTGTTVVDHLLIRGTVKSYDFGGKEHFTKHKRNLSIAPGQLWRYDKTKRVPKRIRAFLFTIDPRGRYKVKAEILIDGESFGSREIKIEVK